MEDKFKQKYRIPPARLTGWDYGSHALYYVTICTKNRTGGFGEIKRDDQGTAHLFKTPIGYVAYKNWLEIPTYHPYVELYEFVIMPDHVHGVLFINKPDKVTWKVNKFGVQSKNLASIIRGYKSSVKQFAMLNNVEFTWQSRYYDRVIRNEKEYINIAEYIYNNPDNWLRNKDHGENL